MLDFQISLPIVYRIRRLLRQYRHQLKSVVCLGAGLVAEAEADLNAVLESLYLEPEEIAIKSRRLELLACQHQLIAQQPKPDSKELFQIEMEIFWILGLKLTRESKPSDKSGSDRQWVRQTAPAVEPRAEFDFV